MDLIKKLYEKENYKSGLLAVEKIGLAYNAVTMVLLFVMFGRMHKMLKIHMNFQMEGHIQNSVFG